MSSVDRDRMPKLLAAEFMLLVQTVLNFLIPSGQAVVSMPITAPVADLVGVSRQIAVLCFRFVDGISNLLWPTGMVLIVAGIAGVKVEKWWKWFIPLFFMILATQIVCIAIAVLINWA